MDDPAISAAEIVKGRTGTPVHNENQRIIEEYKNYFIGFAEFDDQGWAYSNGQQLDVIRQRIDAELANPSYDNKDFLVLVFVHGWHHNAHNNDGNVQEFRQMVNIAANGLESGVENGFLKTHRRVIGIYVGWRGESVDAVPFNYLTVFDRRNAAERVATGAVRQLFANLRAQQLAAQAAAVGRSTTPAARMRTVVIGHSFGGLIAYSALSQAELNELTLDQTGSGPNTAPGWRVWPDALVLINPAFESSRYESFDRLIKQGRTASVHTAKAADAPAALAPAPKPTASVLVIPHFIVVAGEKDYWTGKYFTAGRALTTLFEGYDRTDAAATRAERTANLHAIAFVEAYQTHRLQLNDMQPGQAVAYVVPRLASQVPVDSPVWVVKADDAIVHGHDGFLYGVLDKKKPLPYLANWLLALYDRDCNAAPQMANCVK